MINRYLVISLIVLIVVLSKFKINTLWQVVKWLLLYFVLMVCFTKTSDYSFVMALIILYYSYKKEYNIINIKLSNCILAFSSGVLINEVLTTIILFLITRLIDLSKYKEVVTDTVDYTNEIDGTFLYLLCTVGILVPLAEELLFRYIMIGKIYRDSNIYVKIIVPSLIYGVMHQVTLQIILVIMIGLILDIIYVKTEDIMTTISLHSGLNIIALIGIKTTYSNYLYILSLLLVIVMLIYNFKKKGIKKNEVRE